MNAGAARAPAELWVVPAPGRRASRGREGAIGAVDNSFVAYVLDQLGQVEGLGCRAMFGGHGLYRGQTFFGIVSAGRLYLKTDEATAPEYVSRGMRPFHPNDRLVLKTYYEVPGDVLDDRVRLTEWAEAAVRCAEARAAGAKRSGDSGAGRASVAR